MANPVLTRLGVIGSLVVSNSLLQTLGVIGSLVVSNSLLQTFGIIGSSDQVFIPDDEPPPLSPLYEYHVMVDGLGRLVVDGSGKIVGGAVERRG